MLELGSIVSSAFQKLEGAYIALLLSGFYIIVKAVVKAACRRIAGMDANVSEVIAWFGVDASLLSVTFSAGLNLTSRCKFSSDGTIIWYVLAVAFVMISVACYLMHLRWRKQECGRWKMAMRNAASLTLAVVIGLVPFLTTMSLAMEADRNARRNVGSAESHR